MIEYFVPVVNVLGSLCSIFSFQALRHNKPPKWNWINLALTALLLTTAVLSILFIRAHDAERNARVFYNRYKDKSFTRDFPDDKLRAVVMDGMIILRRIELSRSDPAVYKVIEKKYEEVTTDPFSKENYAALARMIFGACGSICGDLYSKSSHVWPAET